MSPQDPSSSRSLFISHKHVDKQIADEISSFVTMHSGGRVDVYQSSSQWADAPKVGRNLNKQLRETLWNTGVLILVYTNTDHDWSYCMWECGVASHPQSPDTKIILFQCAGSSPAVFTEQVNVNMRNIADIQKFTNEFLTSTDFFPGTTAAVTRFKSNGREVIDAANDFFKKLEIVLPPDKIEPSTEWPAYPFLQFELSVQHIDQIRKLDPKERNQKSNEIIKKECVVSAVDKYCEQLFGVLSFSNEMTFKQLADDWMERFPRSESRWIEALCNQIKSGATWNFPTTSWDLMQGFSDNIWRAPVLTRVRSIPSRRCTQFDIYFFKFDVNEGADSFNIPIPKSTRKKKSGKETGKSYVKKKHSAAKKLRKVKARSPSARTKKVKQSPSKKLKRKLRS